MTTNTESRYKVLFFILFYMFVKLIGMFLMGRNRKFLAGVAIGYTVGLTYIFCYKRNMVQLD